LFTYWGLKDKLLTREDLLRVQKDKLPTQEDLLLVQKDKLPKQ
jgi:hypothetical protein